MNWAKFSVAEQSYRIIIFMFFFAYVAGLFNGPNQTLYVGCAVIMLGILLLINNAAFLTPET